MRKMYVKAAAWSLQFRRISIGLIFFLRNIFFFFSEKWKLFFKKNKRRIFHYNKLKLQQNDIKTKRYTILKFVLWLQSMKNSEKQTESG